MICRKKSTVHAQKLVMQKEAEHLCLKIETNFFKGSIVPFLCWAKV